MTRLASTLATATLLLAACQAAPTVTPQIIYVTPAPVADTPEPVAAATPAPSPTPRPPPTPRATPQILLEETGSGIKKTITFTTTTPSALAYAFDCGERQGNFQVFLYEPPEVLRGVSVNELAQKGNDVAIEYATGQFYLQINSTCNWFVRVGQP